MATRLTVPPIGERPQRQGRFGDWRQLAAAPILQLLVDKCRAVWKWRI